MIKELNRKSGYKPIMPADLLRPFIQKIADNRLRVTETTRVGEYHIFHIFPSLENGQRCAMKIFSKPDGLIEMIHWGNDGEKQNHKVFGRHESLKDYSEFQDMFIDCFASVYEDKQGILNIVKVKVPLCARLYLREFETNPDFWLLPSQIHSEWQESRGRDGVSPNGQIIPHLG